MADIKVLLVPGMENQASVDLLLSFFPKMTSEPLKLALSEHLVNGESIDMVVKLNGIKQGNFSRGLARLNSAAVRMNSYFELNYSRTIKHDK